ncbi:DUF72 domain-containing protein [Shimazuella kribbensis]|uniref:DUF72 domain-containing protein n=1 Tax=Shimazuella kribbensis TaxID=139808 RepID=UPI000423A1BD|nr:DUF72 domain-containing protein [Shimazuella kribbensis]
MSSILVGVCGWGDHDIYPPGTKAADKLSVYAGHFPVVEIDSTFYAIAPADRMDRWVKSTPDTFRFVVKAYRELTGHGRTEKAPERTWSELVEETKASLLPLRQTGKLSLLLFQFPPWYDCKESHVRYIQKVRHAFADYPIAIEFRHQSWFSSVYHEKTLSFLASENLVHVVCDEPQVPVGSVPIITKVTNQNHVLVRFHGRNINGWSDSKNPNWRDVRYAYRYSSDELDEWVERVKHMMKETNQMILLFNNNSKGDAVDNAKQFIQKYGISYTNLAPRQSELF